MKYETSKIILKHYQNEKVVFLTFGTAWCDVNLLFIVYQEVSDSYDILAQESQNSCLTLTLGRNEWVGGCNFHYSV